MVRKSARPTTISVDLPACVGVTRSPRSTTRKGVAIIGCANHKRSQGAIPANDYSPMSAQAFDSTFECVAKAEYGIFLRRYTPCSESRIESRALSFACEVRPGSLAEPSHSRAGIQPARRRQTPEQTANPLNLDLLLSADGSNGRGKLRDVRQMLAGDRPPLSYFSGGDHMIGTITKRARQDGKLAWGYSLGATRSSPGRTPARKRIQITKSGFETRKEAADALRKAIEQRRLDGDIRARTVAAGQGGVSLVLLVAPVPEN
jgi:Arm DNA-binding domain